MAGEFRCRVIAPDAPGLGQSPPLRRGSLSAGAAAGLTRALLDSLGVELCAAVGHSWGADVACLVAAADPARVRALVLLDGGFVDAADWPWNRLRRSVPTAVWAAIARRQGTAGPRPWAEAVRAHARGAPVSTAYPAVAASGAAVLVLLAETYEPSIGRARERGLARLRRALPDADVRVLPSVGHDLPGEAGPEVGRIMGEWL
jgi:pimeloyl-ACP methyl ester carboxylesterase